jgi:photoactive yellow protein
MGCGTHTVQQRSLISISLSVPLIIMISSSARYAFLLDHRGRTCFYSLLENLSMSAVSTRTFDEEALLWQLNAFSDMELDDLAFGVIGFDAKTVVRRYNAYESDAAGLSRQRVIGHTLFTVVAPCMNNYLVAQRFQDAATDGGELDTTIDYVLTLRMRPVKVKLRLLSAPDVVYRYVLVNRTSGSA